MSTVEPTVCDMCGELQSPNIPLFAKIMQQVTEHPETWRQESWGELVNYWDLKPHERQPSCGTTQCIAGWAAVFTGAKPVWTGPTFDNVKTPQGTFSVEEHSARQLGLCDCQAGELFYTFNNSKVWKLIEEITNYEVTQQDIEQRVKAQQEAEKVATRKVRVSIPTKEKPKELVG